METDEYDEDYKEEEIIEYRGLAMEEARVLMTSHETREEHKMMQILVISDQMKILARASGSGNLLSQQDKTKDPSSIDMIGLPSIDGLYEYGNRPYDHSARRRFHWDRRDEYDIYGDEHGNARVVDGRIIHVSREDIREIMERAAIDGHTHICLPKYAEKFTKTMSDPEPDTYSRADIDDMVHGIYKAQEMSLDDYYMRLDDVVGTKIHTVDFRNRRKVKNP
ncbi:hypothetical protein DY000_02016670 [Brassica cretica]|uniref:Uncharacterized protein n=1 Tax=Brassica cretica TaxID=69181 RepID=A0ABQ7D814_BRACR|nr:hypothetical protein DY000_02016670 [Brassica cretica]